jgi:hypothetical protein
VPVLAAAGTPFSGNEGQVFSGNVATYAGGACPCTATIDWGDGTVGSGTASSGTVTGSHAYAAAGSKTATVTVTDAAGVQSSAGATGTISDPDLVVGVSGFSATVGTSFSSVVATVGDPGGTESLANYAATIDWGDGTTSAGTIVDASSGFTVDGTHTYPSVGSVTIKVTVKESDRSSGTAATGTVTVAAASSAPQAAAPQAPQAGGAGSGFGGSAPSTSSSFALPPAVPMSGMLVVFGIVLVVGVLFWRRRGVRLS